MLLVVLHSPTRTVKGTIGNFMASPTKDIKKVLPKPNSDFYQLLETLPAEELAVLNQGRTVMETKVAPIITKYLDEDSFHFELYPPIKEINIGGVAINSHGCRDGNAHLFVLDALGMAGLAPLE